MEESKIAVSLGNLETFKAEVDASVIKKIAEAPAAGVTFATTEQIKALFAEDSTNEGENA